MTSPVLTRDSVREADDRRIEPVEVPEWGGMLYVKGLTGVQRDEFEMSMLDVRKGGKAREINVRNLRAKLIVRTAVNSDDWDNAKPVFTLADETWLGEKSAAPIQRIYDVASRLSGLSAAEVDEMTAEMGEVTSEGSGTDSQDTSATLPFALPNGTSTVGNSPDGSSTTSTSPSENGD